MRGHCHSRTPSPTAGLYGQGNREIFLGLFELLGQDVDSVGLQHRQLAIPGATQWPWLSWSLSLVPVGPKKRGAKAMGQVTTHPAMPKTEHTLASSDG